MNVILRMAGRLDRCLLSRDVFAGRSLRGWTVALLLGLAAGVADASPADGVKSGGTMPVEPALHHLQSILDQGDPEAVYRRMRAEEGRRPRNARIQYNLGVAAYVTGRMDEALVAFDRAEMLGNRSITRRARFQRGNAEYRLGEQAREVSLDDTIARWKTALRTYRDVLVEDAEHPMAENNFRFVRRSLMDLLLTQARQQMEESRREGQPPPRRLENLRNAFQKYQEAREVDPDNEEAAQGESESREELAQALAEQGRRLASMPLRSRPNPREPALPDIDTSALEEGVGMLSDAQQLKPEDAGIRKSLEQGQNRLADASVMKAQSYLMLEERIGWVHEKLALLRMAREVVEKALDQVPDHQPALATLDEIQRRMAEVHEDEGDHLSQQAAMMPDSPANLEQQAMNLSQALDHFQQASEIQPQNGRLPPKIDRTEERLADALDRLADQLMQGGAPDEGMEQQIARLEGADQALNQLQGMRPSQRTEQRAQQVGQQLQALREAMAQQGEQAGQQGESGPPRPGRQPGPQWSQFGVPMDSRPRIDTPGRPGEWNSRFMNSARDY